MNKEFKKWLSQQSYRHLAYHKRKPSWFIEGVITNKRLSILPWSWNEIINI